MRKKCMEYRKAMGKEDIKVLADVQVKHAHMVLPYITVEQSAKKQWTAERMELS
mgnify:CR=1 FL=1